MNRQVAAKGAGADPMAPAQPDWLRHDLVISGPAIDVQAFQSAAAGSGAIPWHLPDLSLAEEDQLHALLNPPDGSRGLSLAAARILARQLRSAVESQADRVIQAAGRSKACPFDLHALLPIPAMILQRGPDHPGSRAWLRQHWGVVQSLRQVRQVTGLHGGSPRRSARIAYEFWSADWTPWPALGTLRKTWPSLVFDCRPDYAHG
ncbi:hypothetical protein ACELLULO517_20845 [Acidisoma cellulosilytica]|uniref:Uncharacterized protein n=1 Tax=Acidisoma cellulosilyticum TaxID=2802395 RepID=A0A964E5I2_9PROT|nr:hypothetical protein [Acidisoma cellulosilyticum]MCB8882705.1 hypothetical protein [Acidisoma cellulosilyticum]